MQTFQHVDSPTASQKTLNAARNALAFKDFNFCFVVPTVKLASQTAAMLIDLDPTCADRIKTIWANSGWDRQEESVVARICTYLEQRSGNGHILIITHRAFQLMPKWNRRDEWNLLIDEAMEVAFHFTLKVPKYRRMLTDLIHETVAYDQDYAHVEAMDCGEIDDILHTDDEFAALLKPLAERMASHSHWQLFVETDQWRKFLNGELHRPSIHGLLHPAIFDGFASVTFLCANFKKTLLYLYYSRMGGVRFKPHPHIKPAFDRHTNGSRLTVLRFTDEEWSKRARFHTIIHDGVERPAMEVFVEQAAKRLGAKFLYLMNRDDRGKNPIWLQGGEKEALCGIPSGFNCYTDHTAIVCFSALRPDTQHATFMSKIAHITENEMRGALQSETAYQAIGRTNIRLMNSNEPVTAVVPDALTSAAIAEYYPQCKTGLLLGYDPFDAISTSVGGRPRKWASEAERLKAYREKKKKETYGNPLESHRSNPFGNGTTDQGITTSTRDMAAIETWRTRMSASLSDMAQPKQTGFHLSIWHKQETKTPFGDERFMSSDEMVDFLHENMRHEYSSKESTPLVIPAHFNYKLDPTRGHADVNVAYKHGIIMDLDHTPHTIERVAELLNGIAFFATHSWSHSPEDWRYRLYFPTACAMPSELSNAILRHLSGLLGDKEGGGVDTSKFNASAMMRLPTARPHEFFADYRDGRAVIDPHRYVDLVAPVCYPPVVIAEVPPPAGYSPRRMEVFETLREEFRLDGTGRGKSDHAMFDLGRKLAKYGMALPDVEQTLREEAMYVHSARSRQDRLAQIPRIIATLSKTR